MGIHDGSAMQEEKVVMSRKSWLYTAASMRNRQQHLSMTAGESMVGRMRFDIAGKPSGFHDQTAHPAPVTERDLLRSFSHALTSCASYMLAISRRALQCR